MEPRIRQKSKCRFRPASDFVANHSHPTVDGSEITSKCLKCLEIMGSLPPGAAWDHAAWQNSVPPWQVSKWWCDGHPQAGRDLVPWQVRKPVGHVLVMNLPVAAACLAWLKILFPNALGKTCLGSIAEAMLFGILPPLLLSGALENPKLWVSSATTADFGGILPVALDGICGIILDFVPCKRQNMPFDFNICDIM